ncbi:helix-turn-helix domain-containing protein [Paenibacillus pinihumi]|uniref:helix-turn-helix domain-containing protein n=1 Tax=Paenibacillus pinihumi TaxID=669462 RepID=UPI00041FB17A|nr:helix-turn-helix transcriptional regulator [Paenibacillus pinihumi]
MFRLKLDTIMEERGLNAKQLSDLTGIRWNTVKDMEKNESRHWSPDNLNKIMIALELKNVEDLIEYVDEG